MDIDEAALDTFLANDGAPAAEEAPQSDPAPQATEPEVDLETLPEGDKFDRAYVEKLRRESANYRDRAKKYNDAFDGYEDEAVQEWLSLATSLRNDPRSAAQRFAELAEAINQQYADEAVSDEPPVSDNEMFSEDRPLTRAEVEKLLADRDREADMQRRVAQIHADAQSLGYQKGTQDYDRLLWEAGRLPSGSIQDAHAKLQAERQAVIDGYLAKLGTAPNPVVPQGGAPASQEKGFDSFEEASAALDAWLAGQ